MSCPDWRRLASLREAAGGGDEPSAWSSALEHLRDCRACRSAALIADPSLVFVEARAWEVPQGEVEQLIGNVRAMRRLRERESGDRDSRRSWMSLAAAALLAVGLGLVGGSRQPQVGPSSPASGSAVAVFPADRGALSVSAGSALTPVLEELNRPEARIYQLREDDLSIVMIVDETFDL